MKRKEFLLQLPLFYFGTSFAKNIVGTPHHISQFEAPKNRYWHQDFQTGDISIIQNKWDAQDWGAPVLSQGESIVFPKSEDSNNIFFYTHDDWKILEFSGGFYPYLLLKNKRESDFIFICKYDKSRKKLQGFCILKSNFLPSLSLQDISHLQILRDTDHPEDLILGFIDPMQFYYILRYDVLSQNFQRIYSSPEPLLKKSGMNINALFFCDKCLFPDSQNVFCRVSFGDGIFFYSVSFENRNVTVNQIAAVRHGASISTLDGFQFKKFSMPDIDNATRNSQWHQPIQIVTLQNNQQSLIFYDETQRSFFGLSFCKNQDENYSPFLSFQFHPQFMTENGHLNLLFLEAEQEAAPPFLWFLQRAVNSQKTQSQFYTLQKAGKHFYEPQVAKWVDSDPQNEFWAGTEIHTEKNARSLKILPIFCTEQNTKNQDVSGGKEHLPNTTFLIQKSLQDIYQVTLFLNSNSEIFSHYGVVEESANFQNPPQNHKPPLLNMNPPVDPFEQDKRRVSCHRPFEPQFQPVIAPLRNLFSYPQGQQWVKVEMPRQLVDEGNLSHRFHMMAREIQILRGNTVDPAAFICMNFNTLEMCQFDLNQSGHIPLYPKYLSPLTSLFYEKNNKVLVLSLDCIQTLAHTSPKNFKREMLNLGRNNYFCNKHPFLRDKLNAAYSKLCKLIASDQSPDDAMYDFVSDPDSLAVFQCEEIRHVIVDLDQNQNSFHNDLFSGILYGAFLRHVESQDPDVVADDLEEDLFNTRGFEHSFQEVLKIHYEKSLANTRSSTDYAEFFGYRKMFYLGLGIKLGSMYNKKGQLLTIRNWLKEQAEITFERNLQSETGRRRKPSLEDYQLDRMMVAIQDICYTKMM